MKDFQTYKFVPGFRADSARLEYPDGTVYTLREATLIAIGGDTVDLEQIDIVKKQFDGEIESVRLSCPGPVYDGKVPFMTRKSRLWTGLDRLGESLPEPEGGKNE